MLKRPLIQLLNQLALETCFFWIVWSPGELTKKLVSRKKWKMKHSISISREEMKKKYILKLLLSFVIIFSELTGTWNVKPQGMMSFDATTGLAVALRTGLARISYDFDEERSTVFDVIITKAQKIQFLSYTVHLTNVKNSIQAVSFDIVSNDETGNLK